MNFKQTLSLVFLLVVFGTGGLLAQSTFQKTVGGVGDDFATWVLQTTNGYVVAGQGSIQSDSSNAYLLQLDNTGNILWQKNYGTGFHFTVVVDAWNGYLALGQSDISINAPDIDIFLVRTDLAGNTMWSKKIGNPGTIDLGLSLVAVSGGYLLSGGQATVGSPNYYSFLTRLDLNGNTIWSKTYDSGGFGNLIRSNYVEGNVIYASGAAEGAATFVRLDLTNGDVLGSVTYDGTSTEALYFQQPTQDSNIVLADHTWSATGGTEIRQWVQKVTKPEGQILWSKVYGKPGLNLRGPIERISDGGFLLNPYDNFSGPSNNGMLAKIDANGNLLWSYEYGGNQEDRLIKAIQTTDGGFMAVGYSRSNSVNGKSDIFIVKTDANGLITGCCVPSAGLQASNFIPGDLVLNFIPTNSHLADSFNIGSIGATLPDSAFCRSNPPIDSQDITLCPNQTFTLNGIQYQAPTVVIDTILSNGGGCDSITVYTLLAAPYNTSSQLIQFCSGDSIIIGGQVYTQSGTVVDTLSTSSGGCDTIATYTLQLLPQPTQSDTIQFCAGDSITINGQIYTQSGTVTDIIASNGGGCDTIITYTLLSVIQFAQNTTIKFCPGDSVTIAGQVYGQSGTIIDTISSNSGACDTVVTYTLLLLVQPTQNDTIQFCPGDSITINGQVYSQSGTVIDTVSSNGNGCDTIVTYTLQLLVQPTQNDTIQFCPGDSITIGGQVYSQSGTVIDTVASNGNGCDTIVTYTLQLLTQPTQSVNIQFCPGDSVNIGGQVYNQAGTVIDTVSSNSGGCDTVVTYTLVVLPQPVQNNTIQFCPGESVTINGQVYNQSTIVVDTISGTSGGCDTIATYTLVLLQQPVRSETIGFCVGDSVTINGVIYTQPGNALDTLPAIGGGCDTLVSYILQFLTPAPSTVTIDCPNDVNVITFPGSGPTVANYNLPTTTTDCPCPGLELTLTAGLPSGSLFPVATTQVCYMAQDSCGDAAMCCFSVTIREEQPCDVKMVACMKYEILSITKDAGKNHTFRIRVTNNCPNKMIYTAIQLPDGVVADEPANLSVYISPNLRKYDVRNPNFSPFYSVRFKSTTDSISNGQSDVFEYTLPAQSGVPTYINIGTRLTNQLFYEAHLNTFNCPIGITPSPKPELERNSEKTFAHLSLNSTLKVFPNPTSGVLYANLSDWNGERLQVQILNGQGQRVQLHNVTAMDAAQQIELPGGLVDGLYFVEILTENGQRQMARFVLQH